MDQESPDGEFPPCVPKGRKPFHTPPGPGLFDADPSPGPFNTTPWSYPFAGQNKDGQKKGRAPHIPSTRALREGPRQSLSRSWYAAMYAGWEQQGLPRAQIARNKQDIARILETYIKPLPRKALESADIQRVINRVLVGHVRNLGLRVQIKQSPLLKKVKQEILSLKARISEDLLQATVNICLRQEREGERLHEVQNKDLFGEILIEDLLKGIVKGVMAFIHEKDCVAMSRRLPDEQVGEALGKAVLFEDNPQDLSRLLKMGLPADIKDPQGTTALEKAILLHRKDAVEVLLQHGGGQDLKRTFEMAVSGGLAAFKWEPSHHLAGAIDIIAQIWRYKEGEINPEALASAILEHNSGNNIYQETISSFVACVKAHCQGMPITPSSSPHGAGSPLHPA